MDSLDPQTTLAMSGVEETSPLYQLVDQLLPGVEYEVRTEENTAILYFPKIYSKHQSVCWVKLTSHRQIVKVSSFWNPSAFVCDYNDEGYPFFALAAPWQDFENSSISAQKLTILPSVKESPVSILVVLAFQSQSSDLELLVDRANKTINGFKLNSEEVVFGDYRRSYTNQYASSGNVKSSETHWSHILSAQSVEVSYNSLSHHN